MKSTIRLAFLVTGVLAVESCSQGPASTPAICRRIVSVTPERESDLVDIRVKSGCVSPQQKARRREGSRYRVAYGSYRGKLYDAVYNVVTTPDLRHFAYVAQEGDRRFVVLDHREEPPFEKIRSDSIRISDDGTRVAYVLRLSRDRSEWIADGRRLPESDCLRDHPVFSPDGRHLAYSIRTKAGQAGLYLDGEVSASYEDAVLERLTFSPDSKRLLYVLNVIQGKRRVVIDGEAGPEFDNIRWAYPGWDQTFFFSPDARRVAYVGRRDGRDVLVVDQSPGKPPEAAEILGIVFSPDSRRVACMARKAGERKWFVIVDGAGTTPRGYVLFGSISFSPDGKHLAYTTRVDGGWTVVVDDVPGAVYKGIAGWVPLRFHGPDRFHYVVVDEGGQYLVVEERL